MYEISGSGPTNSPLVIVSDYPQKDDIAAAQVLSGKSGSSLGYYLSSQKFKLEDTYRTSVIKVVRDDFFVKAKKIREKALKNAFDEFPHLETLKNELRLINPNCVVALGELALNTLSGGLRGIDNYRGSILKVDPRFSLKEGTKLVPTYHPRQIWKKSSDTPLLQFDIERACKLSRSPYPHSTKNLVWRVRTTNELKKYWDRAQSGEFMVFDIETWRGFITCIGFCTNGYEAVSVPLFDYDNIVERIEIWKLLDRMLKSSMPKVNQNIKYDLHYLEKFGFRINHIHDDTSLLGRIIYPEFNVRLALLQSIYTELPYHKDEGHEYSPVGSGKEQLYLYNAKDCLSTWLVYDGQKKDARDYKVMDFHRKNYWDNGLFHIYRRMDGRGIRIDFDQRNKLVDNYNSALFRHKEAVEEFYGQSINIRSSKQVADFVYEFLQCPKIYKQENDSGVRSLDTGKEALEELYLNKVSDNKVKTILKRIIIVRKLEKILEYLTYLVHPDGRVRASTKLNGTKSGRTSQTAYEDSLFWKNEKETIQYKSFGGSLQVIPKRPFEAEEFEGEVFGSDVSSIFVPTPGYVFVEGDGGAAEARVVAVLAGDFETLEMMDKTDIHKLTASWTLDKQITAVTSYDREVFGKRPRHAGNYDMGAYRLALMIHKAVDLCEKILERFHANVPKVRGVFHTLVRQIVTNKRILHSPHGRHRQFFGNLDSSLFKEAYSMIPQATVSDHTKFTMPLIQQDVESCEFLLEKHDSLLMEVPYSDAEYLFDVFKQHMERPISFRSGSIIRDFDLVIPAEIKWSADNWMDMKKVKF